MIILIYALMGVGVLLLGGAAWMLGRDRMWSLILLGAAILCGLAVMALTTLQLGRGVSAEALANVRRAAQEDSQVDAAAQWALDDDAVTPAEYSEIAQIYRERTGRDIAQAKGTAR